MTVWDNLSNHDRFLFQILWFIRRDTSHNSAQVRFSEYWCFPLQKVFYPILFVSCLLVGCGDDKRANAPATQQDVTTLERAADYQEAGQYRAAFIELRKAAGNKALTVVERRRVLLAQARWFLSLGQYRRALSILSTVPEANQNSDILQALLEGYLGAGKLGSAEELLNGTEAERIPQSQRLLSRAKIAFARRHPLETIRYLRQLEALMASWDVGENVSPASETLDTTLTKTLQAEIAVVWTMAELALNHVVEAEAKLDLALQNDPDSVPVLLAKAQVYGHLGEFEKAEDLLSDALMRLPETDLMEPQKVRVLTALVSILGAQGRTSEAVVYSRILAEQNPQVAELQARLDVALDLWREGKLAEARDELMSIYQDAPTDHIGAMLGLVSFLLGDEATASNYFETHLDPETASPSLLEAMTQSFIRAGRMDDTLAALEQAYSRDTANGKIESLLGLVKLMQQDPEGHRLLTQGLEKEPHQKHMWLALAKSQLSVSTDEAIATLEKALEYLPGDYQLQLNLMSTLWKVDRHADARAIVESGFRVPEPTLTAQLLAMKYALLMEDTDEAKKQIKIILARDPENSIALIDRAKIALHTQDFSIAKSTAKHLIEQNPDHPLAYFLFTRAVEGEISEFDRAEKSIVALVVNQNRAAGYVALSDFYRRYHQLEKAERSLREARRIDPGLTNLNQSEGQLAFQRAKQYLSASDFLQARNELMRSLQYQPHDLHVLILLIRLELEMGNIREAEKLMSQVPEHLITTDEQAVLTGSLALKKGNVSDAENILTQSWEKQASDQVGQTLYQVLKAQNKPVDDFLRQWASRSNSVLPIVHQGNELLEKEDYLKAIHAYESVFAQLSGNADALNNLAWAYHKMKDDKALETAEAAKALAPNNPNVLDTYGVILLAKGETEKAREVLTRAQSLAPENVSIEAHWRQANEK